jgi:predicted enzyme involved in methoxymalonyl-ACP biosynthesis
VAGVAYQDKFGPLGTIAVLQGVQHGAHLCIDVWVMSCRAFARRIEHQCLKALFEKTGAEEIQFHFVPTERNGPLREFFRAMLGEEPGVQARLTRSQFEQRCPPLYHRIRAAGQNQPIDDTTAAAVTSS